MHNNRISDHSEPLCGQEVAGNATGGQPEGQPVSFPAIVELDARIAKLRPARKPKLPSEGGTPYLPGGSLDTSMGPGPLDELELYLAVENMPAVTGKGREPHPLGLSTLHISPQTKREPQPTVSIARGGSYMEVHARQTGVNRARVGARRGMVKGFTAAARKRCLSLMACIDRSALPWLPLFAALTYHFNIPDDPKVWKRQLATFCKRVERKYGKRVECDVDGRKVVRYEGISIVWKLEPQKRGAPHFHLLIFGAQNIPHEWIADNWNAIVEPGNELHRKAGTRVERVKSWDGVMAYAAKYIGKEHEGFSEQYGHVGRYWGVRGGEYLPIKMDSVSVSWREYFKLRRVMRGYIERKRVLGHMKRIKIRDARRFAVRAARAGPRPGRGYWGGISMFIACDVAMRLYVHVIGG